MLHSQKFLLVEGGWKRLGAWDVAREGQAFSTRGAGWKAEQKELETGAGEVLSAEDTRLGEALHLSSCLSLWGLSLEATKHQVFPEERSGRDPSKFSVQCYKRTLCLRSYPVNQPHWGDMDFFFFLSFCLSLIWLSLFILVKCLRNVLPSLNCIRGK